MKHGIAPYVPLSALDATLLAQKGTHFRRDRAILMVSHYLGLRSMEIAALNIGDVLDITTGKLREVIRLLVTKGQRYREVYLVNERARETLRLYLTERSLRDVTSPLFLSQRGGRFSANTMQRLLAICYDRAGIAASSHSGRRSFATHLIENGTDIYSVKEMMGHASIMSTEKYFATSPVRLKKFAGLLV